MLKEKIFNLVNEKFEGLQDTLKDRFENFEGNIEINKNLHGRDGFIPFVDGFICLSSFIYTSDLISSGNFPNYLNDYCNNLESLAYEYSIEQSEDLDERDEIYYNYLSDDFFYIEVNFYWYDKDGKGHGQDKIYFDYSIKNEYGKTLCKVDQKGIDDSCITDEIIDDTNYIEVIEKAINKIVKFI